MAGTAPVGADRHDSVCGDRSGWPIISPTPELTAAVPATPPPVSQTYTFTIPAGTTQMCGRWMLVPDGGGQPKFADALCTAVRPS